MQAALERHDHILRTAVEGHGGYIFATGGDGFAVAFNRVGDALAAAVAAQEELGVESWPEGRRSGCAWDSTPERRPSGKVTISARP